MLIFLKTLLSLKFQFISLYHVIDIQVDLGI